MVAETSRQGDLALMLVGPIPAIHMTLQRTILLLGVCCALSGCYLLQAAQGQMSLTAKRQPIAAVIADPRTEATLRTRLEYVQAARRFAVSQLALPDNRSYTTYVELNRRYVVWNVFAAPEFSVEPKRWCFPVAGCVVYRGYFHQQAAERYALRLRARGYDASVGGAVAYSTLGHFNDPVVSSMLQWSDAQLAATLFHELAHQVVYVPGDSAFNEAFAVSVEEAGLERWLAARGHRDELQRWQLRRQRGAEFSALLLDTRRRLQNLYASKVPPQAMRDRKQQLLGELKFRYALLKQQWNGDVSYDGWVARRLSNADFIVMATYESCVPAFARLLHDVNDELPRFYTRVKALARGDRAARQEFCKAQ